MRQESGEPSVQQMNTENDPVFLPFVTSYKKPGTGLTCQLFSTPYTTGTTPCIITLVNKFTLRLTLGALPGSKTPAC